MSHGRLTHHEVGDAKGLEDAPLAALGAELLRRLQTPANQASRVDLERHLNLLTTLRDELDERLEVPENRLAIAQSRRQFQFVGHCVKNHGLPIRGAVHVDVGCGSVNPLARMMSHLMFGARQVCAIDLDVPASFVTPAKALARMAAAALVDPTSLHGEHAIGRDEILRNLDGFDLARLQAGDIGGIDAARMEFRPAPIESTGLATGSVDVVFSHSVLEHVDDPDAVIAELARITKPGGYGVHGIDTRDHRWYGEPALHPLEFLTIDSDAPIVHGCNRKRLVEFRAILARHGFQLVEHWLGEKVAIPPELRARLVAPWRSLPDDLLDVTWGQALVRRAM